MKNKMYAANVGRATIMDEQNTVPEVSKNVKIQKDVQAMVCVCVVAAQYPLTCFIHFIS